MARARKQIPHDGSVWVLDKRIPLALVLGLLLQAAAILTWANNMTSKVSNMEGDISFLKQEARERANKLPILETELRHIGTVLTRLESSLEKIRDERESRPRANPSPRS